MTNFIRPVDYHGQLFEFSFARILTVNGPKYFVMVTDSIREYHFIIEKKMGEWALNDAPRVPEWIHELEGRLIQIIIENEVETI